MPEIRLQNDAAARVGTVRVRCGAIRERTPDDPGARQGGLSARLILPGGDEVTVWLRIVITYRRTLDATTRTALLARLG